MARELTRHLRRNPKTSYSGLGILSKQPSSEYSAREGQRLFSSYDWHSLFLRKFFSLSLSLFDTLRERESRCDSSALLFFPTSLFHLSESTRLVAIDREHFHRLASSSSSKPLNEKEKLLNTIKKNKIFTLSLSQIEKERRFLSNTFIYFILFFFFKFSSFCRYTRGRPTQNSRRFFKRAAGQTK